METVTIIGWLIGRRYYLGPPSMVRLTPIASSAVTGTLANACFGARGAYLTFFAGRRMQNYVYSKAEEASMDFKVGDIVRVDVAREPYPDELGIIVSVYPGFAWANYVRFPFANKEMLISTRWLTKVGEAVE